MAAERRARAGRTKESAGLLVYRLREDKLEVLLIHPGGPFWKRKDEGAWSLPKGEIEPGETPLDVARREFKEELGQAPPDGEVIGLGSVRQAGGKVVQAWAAPGDLDVSNITSAAFDMEWPPKSGRQQSFPEVDRAEWFGLDVARQKILDGQRTFLDRLEAELTKGGR
jgi:predicted NUDIX family NTP pyrophosphohydrolase